MGRKIYFKRYIPVQNEADMRYRFTSLAGRAMDLFQIFQKENQNKEVLLDFIKQSKIFFDGLIDIFSIGKTSSQSISWKIDLPVEAKIPFSVVIFHGVSPIIQHREFLMRTQDLECCSAVSVTTKYMGFLAAHLPAETLLKILPGLSRLLFALDLQPMLLAGAAGIKTLLLQFDASTKLVLKIFSDDDHFTFLRKHLKIENPSATEISDESSENDLILEIQRWQSCNRFNQVLPDWTLLGQEFLQELQKKYSRVSSINLEKWSESNWIPFSRTLIGFLDNCLSTLAKISENQDESPGNKKVVEVINEFSMNILKHCFWVFFSLPKSNCTTFQSTFRLCSFIDNPILSKSMENLIISAAFLHQTDNDGTWRSDTLEIFDKLQCNEFLVKILLNASFSALESIVEEQKLRIHCRIFTACFMFLFEVGECSHVESELRLHWVCINKTINNLLEFDSENMRSQKVWNPVSKNDFIPIDEKEAAVNLSSLPRYFPARGFKRFHEDSTLETVLSMASTILTTTNTNKMFDLVENLNMDSSDFQVWLLIKMIRLKYEDKISIDNDAYISLKQHLSFMIVMLNEVPDRKQVKLSTILEGIATIFMLMKESKSSKVLRRALVDVLPALVRQLGQDDAAIRQSTMCCLLIVARSCEYVSVSDLIVTNFDYIVDDCIILLRETIIDPSLSVANNGTSYLVPPLLLFIFRSLELTDVSSSPTDPETSGFSKILNEYQTLVPLQQEVTHMILVVEFDRLFPFMSGLVFEILILLDTSADELVSEQTSGVCSKDLLKILFIIVAKVNKAKCSLDKIEKFEWENSTKVYNGFSLESLRKDIGALGSYCNKLKIFENNLDDDSTNTSKNSSHDSTNGSNEHLTKNDLVMMMDAIVLAAVNFIFHSDHFIRRLSQAIIKQALCFFRLNNSEKTDNLIHKLWKSLMFNLKNETNPCLLSASFDLIATISAFSRNFIEKRFEADAWEQLQILVHTYYDEKCNLPAKPTLEVGLPVFESNNVSDNYFNLLRSICMCLKLAISEFSNFSSRNCRNIMKLCLNVLRKHSTVESVIQPVLEVVSAIRMEYFSCIYVDVHCFFDRNVTRNWSLLELEEVGLPSGEKQRNYNPPNSIIIALEKLPANILLRLKTILFADSSS